MKKKIIYDYSKLRGRIKEKFKNEKTFAPLIGMNKASLSNKLTNKTPFSQYEIDLSLELLDIPDDEIILYFFCS